VASKGLFREPVGFPEKPRTRRTLDERIWNRLQFLVPLTTAAILRLRRESWLRRRLVVYWVRRSYSIVYRHDFELALAGQHPETRISWTGDAHGEIPPDLVGREFHGHEGFRQAWSAWLDAFEDLRILPREVSDPGGNRILVGYRTVGRGTTSGIPVETEGFTLYTFEDGLVARQQFFTDRAAAEREAGVGE
jgi:ketosteroid isomerase-like protein